MGGLLQLPLSTLMELELYAYPDSDSDRIIISNLAGLLTPDNSKVALINIATETSSSLLPAAVWTQLTGDLTITLDYVAKAFDESPSAFSCANPAFKEYSISEAAEVCDRLSIKSKSDKVIQGR
jgi:hypothetical protein